MLFHSKFGCLLELLNQSHSLGLRISIRNRRCLGSGSLQSFAGYYRAMRQWNTTTPTLLTLYCTYCTTPFLGFPSTLLTVGSGMDDGVLIEPSLVRGQY
ncbi:hypothetical protein BO70DRAFT_60047 [Aspergillus heteromorphus CBS 117.55]|uniref:Uncharacterized protein n=1 Tax=Aspergillus heteromorphus CBS 117.55 TaxID=1448321 RepID=A0A317VZ37_9EURO|nr:uncharacterized protein BO70DRAFT_60047 [Aspergillus heteromorphus CBS 117.55]PWY78227.1 hypothetical protein BO70DRAFT_60047 [Aspergillus heteromorphus CBS 117.55]